MDPELIAAIQGILTWLYGVLGIWGLVGPVLLFGAYWVYQEWKKRHETDALVAEKERSIQRLADENRELRKILYKEVLHYDDARIDSLIVKNQPSNGAESRRIHEGPDPVLPASSSRSNKRVPQRRKQ